MNMPECEHHVPLDSVCQQCRQAPAKATARSPGDIGNELHNISVSLHYKGMEHEADQIRRLACELWKQPTYVVPQEHAHG